jgi:hypothetical protein
VGKEEFIPLKPQHSLVLCAKHNEKACKTRRQLNAANAAVANAEQKLEAAAEEKVDLDPYGLDKHGRHWHMLPVPAADKHPLEDAQCTLLSNSTMLLRQLEGMGCRKNDCSGAVHVDSVNYKNLHGGGSFHLICDKCAREEHFATGMRHEVKMKGGERVDCGVEGTMLVVGMAMHGGYNHQVLELTRMAGIPGITQDFVYKILHAMEEPVETVMEESCELVRRRVEERGDADRVIIQADGCWGTRGRASNHGSAAVSPPSPTHNTHHHHLTHVVPTHTHSPYYPQYITPTPTPPPTPATRS